MDAYLDTFSDELCQVNTYVGRIARRQAQLGGFVASLSPSPKALTNDSDDGADDDDKDKDGCSSDDDEMMTSQ